MKTMTRNQRKRKLKQQRWMGIAMLIISVLIFAMACTGSTTESHDATAMLITLPLGIWLICTKEIIIM